MGASLVLESDSLNVELDLRQPIFHLLQASTQSVFKLPHAGQIFAS